MSEKGFFNDQISRIIFPFLYIPGTVCDKYCSPDGATVTKTKTS